ncbi:MAG TPA: inorganic phosphate transporter [Saprospiraceae bacterium]|nr:inorganic phosphate transporter [Saprospiraceae bacterium]
MEFYLIIVVLLFVLAISDLIVGVSNDAVNFLNSAIGSRVANWRTIMIVASVGIVLGATFASGMMEVARKGIFNPQYFVFAEVMIIFLSVMLTDIILLDLFNTFGMPTSTTVSIVFELLGAAVSVAAIKVMSNGEGLSALSTYINSESALKIIIGIFLSVGVAFTVGAIIQYVTRLLFTFNYEKKMKWVGVVWSGIALAALSYFLLIKGLKGASFVPAAFKQWTVENTFMLLVIAAVAMTVLSLILHYLKINVLRIVVLVGTFALAMAFAGNDLVNFIGVPLAGFESYNTWQASGTEANNLLMESLAVKYPAKTYMLLIAGGIMVLTLWFSKKARSVTETEVNLGRQADGLERFDSNLLSRSIVRGVMGLFRKTSSSLPKGAKEKISEAFSPKEERELNPPAFDLVRASVNLTVASILIAIATSMKLPLSTTYVSFMVAMGTSLSDRAWGRDSAVYRVAGVLNVIGGWFMTAFIAFSVSALFAYLISTFGGWAIVVIVLFAVLFITNTFLYHRRQAKSQKKLSAAQSRVERVPAKTIIDDTAKTVVNSLESIRTAYRASIDGLTAENRKRLQEVREAMKGLAESNEEFKYTFHGSIQRISEEMAEGSRSYLLAYDLQQDIIQSAELITNSIKSHVEDVLMPLTTTQTAELKQIAEDVDAFLEKSAEIIRSRNYTGYEELMNSQRPIFIKIDNLLATQSRGIREEGYSARNSMLFFSILLETKDLIADSTAFVRLYYAVDHELTLEDPFILVNKTHGKG